jgi:DNA-binding transcriptional ArsR family regulator
VTELDDILTTLAEPTRRRIVDILRMKPRRAGELAHIFAMSQPAMSKHLRVLRQHGLVEEESLAEDARVRVYRLKPEPFAQLQRWLEKVASFWTDQLASFKAHAEKDKGKHK